MGNRNATVVHVLKTVDTFNEPPHWMQVFVIRDEYQCVLEFVPAVFGGGWKLHRVSVQGANDWPDMTADRIRTYRFDGHVVVEATPGERESALRLEGERVVAGLVRS